jgi:hypothetical protein
VFIAGVSGFTVTSLWCGLAQSGPELILARLAQGATAALTVPQVLATVHLLFVDSSCARAGQASRYAGADRRLRVPIIGLAMLAAAVACTVVPSALLLTVLGYGQGLVMAIAVLSSVKPARVPACAVRRRRSAMPPVLRRSARCSLRLKPLDRRGRRFMPRARCLRCRLLFAAYFCHGCDARQIDRTLTSKPTILA